MVEVDTHMPKKAKHFPQVLVEGLTGLDLIIHAGDWQMPNVLTQSMT
jgi:predicted phosphodiesterase